MPFERQLQALHELLVKLHVEHPILVGHSYGGTISLGYAERYPGTVRGLVLVDAAAAGQAGSSFERAQAQLVKIMQLPVIRQVANATFGQLLTTVSVNQREDEAFHPQAVVPAHHQRVLAINMTKGNLEAWAGEMLAANGVVAKIDRGLSAIQTPAVVIQGNADELVKPMHGRRLAADLPHARLVMLRGGHMQPYTHPAAIATAVQSLSAGVLAGAPARARARSSATATATTRRPAARSGA